MDREAERAGTYPSNRAQASGRLADLLKQSLDGAPSRARKSAMARTTRPESSSQVTVHN